MKKKKLAASETFLCVQCKKMKIKSDLFTWSCGHWYCTECAKYKINNSLSNNNGIPKCFYLHCNTELTIQNKQKYDPSQIQAIIPAKYSSVKNECLIYGFIKQILYINFANKIIIPNEIILLIFDFYSLHYFKQIICFICLGTDIPTKPKETTCTKCQGLARKCTICHGKGITKQSYKHCWKCYGKKYLISIDFNKLIQKQLLCLQCKHYFPINKTFCWNKCNHTYCILCFEMHAKNQLIRYKNPLCPKEDCKYKEKLQYKWNNKRQCPRNCLNYRCYGSCRCEKYYFRTYTGLKFSHCCERVSFVWSGCKHVFCKGCVALNVKNDLIALKIPKCPLDMFHNDESLISMNNLKSFRSYFEQRFGILGFGFGYHLKQLKLNYVYCKICGKRHVKNEVFLWGNCTHKYGIECMKKYFENKVIVVENNILFCIENNIKEKVICFMNKCNEPLSPADYNGMFGYCAIKNDT
eukprot:302643_1